MKTIKGKSLFCLFIFFFPLSLLFAHKKIGSKVSKELSAPTWGFKGKYFYVIEKNQPTISKNSEAIHLNAGRIGFHWLVIFFQKFISPQDGKNCPKIPVCSVYGKRAFSEFGAVKGALLSFERILRCHTLQDLNERYDPVP